MGAPQQTITRRLRPPIRSSGGGSALPPSFVAQLSTPVADGAYTVTGLANGVPLPSGIEGRPLVVCAVECAEGVYLPTGSVVIAHAVAVMQIDGDANPPAGA